MKQFFAAVFSLILLLPGLPQAQAATPELAVEVESYAPGHPFWVALTLVPASGERFAWRNPGAFTGAGGGAPAFQWSLPEGFSLGGTRWQVPEVSPAHGDTAGDAVVYAYRGPVTILFEILPPRKTAGEGDQRFSLGIAWQGKEAVQTPEAQLFFALGPGSGARQEANRELFAAARAKMPLPSPWPSAARVGADDFRVTVYLDQATLAKTAALRFLPGHPGLADPARPMRITLSDQGVEFRGARARAAPYLEMVDGLLLLVDNAGRVTGAYVIEAWNSIKPLRDPLLSAADDGRDLNMMLALVFALLGGVILNLMPCVFPVLSIKVFALVRAGADSPRRMRVDAIAYTAGILVSFLIVAGVLLVFRGLGAQVGWGFQLQSPGFVLALILMMTLVGMNLAGIFQIPAGALAGLGARWTAKKGATGAFFTGVLATVVATPCTAPFMAPALGYALSQPTALALAVFLALGLGLALPYLLVGMIPALQRHFPKPGPWMETLRKWLALPMFATVLWLMWVLERQTIPGGVTVALAGIAGLLGLVLATPRLPAMARGARWLAYGAAILLAAGYYFWADRALEYDAGGNALRAGAAHDRYEEVEFSRARLAELRRLGRPVFLNFTASWCITCLVTDRLVFETETFSAFMRDNGIIMMKADWTKPDDGIARMLESFGRSGIPFYVFYPADPRKPAVPLPEILTVDSAIELIGRHLD